jgi:hypothetical protein
VDITLSAIDNQNGSGIKEIHYQINSNPEIVINGIQGNLNVGTQGVSLLTYWAVDQAGNKEASHTLEVKIDLTSPVLIMPVLVLSYSFNSSVPFNFSATDTFSGIASEIATLNGSPIVSGANVALIKLGTNTFTFTATDYAGNTTIQSLSFEVTDIVYRANSSGTSSYFSEAGLNAYATFGVDRSLGNSTLTGSLTFNSSKYRRKIVITGVTSLEVTGKTAVFKGICTMNGIAGYSFTVTAVDNATPGSGADTFSITVTGPSGFNYTASGTIVSGDYLVLQQ